jgi:hypothetical protein
MAAADYDRAYRPYDAPAPVREYDRPYRNDIVPYGDRRLDDVVKPPSRPPLPASTRSGGGGGRGVASALCFSDPEMKRRRRVASYKAYSVEGKVKSSLRRGFGWIKAKCSELIHGWYGPHPRRFLIFLLSSLFPVPRILCSSSQYFVLIHETAGDNLAGPSPITKSLPPLAMCCSTENVQFTLNRFVHVVCNAMI